MTQKFVTHEISIFLLLVMYLEVQRTEKCILCDLKHFDYLQMENYFGLIAKNMFDTSKYKG